MDGENNGTQTQQDAQWQEVQGSKSVPKGHA